MPIITVVPKHVSKNMLPGLKVGGLVTNLKEDYSQAKGSFDTKRIPAGTVGKVKKIFDFGTTGGGHRFLCDVKFEGHPLTNLYTEELQKVKL